MKHNNKTFLFDEQKLKNFTWRIATVLLYFKTDMFLAKKSKEF